MPEMTFEEAARIVREIASGEPKEPVTHEQVMQALCVVANERVLKLLRDWGNDA